MVKDTTPHHNFYTPGSEGHPHRSDNFYIDDESRNEPEPSPQEKSFVPQPQEPVEPHPAPESKEDDYFAQLSSAKSMLVAFPSAETRPIPNPDHVGAFRWTEDGRIESLTVKEATKQPEPAPDLKKDNENEFMYHQPAQKDRVEEVKPLADAFMNIMNEADAENTIARDLNRLKEAILDTGFIDSSGQKHTKSEIMNAIDQVYNSIQKKNIAQAELFLRQVPRGYGIREKVRTITGLQKYQEDIARELLEEAYREVASKGAA